MRPLALTDLVGIYLPAAVLLLLLIWGKFKKNLYIFLVLHKGCAHLFWQLNSGRSPIFMQTGHMELTSARGIISKSVVTGR